jgi:hypothetical protein
MHIIKDIQNFTNYVFDFYNIENGIFPIADKETIDKAIYIYLTDPNTNRIDFDSLDRLKVREIIEILINL